MNNERVENIVDRSAVQGDLDFLLGGLKQVDEAIKNFKPITDIYRNADSSAEFRKGQEDLINANQKLAKSQTDLSLAVQEYQKIQNQIAQTQAKMNALQSDAGNALLEAKQKQQQLNQELTKTAQLNSAAAGSINQLRAQVALLTAQYDKMSQAQRNSTEGQTLMSQIEGQVTALKQLEAETGRFQRNVGNYTGAVSILEKQLQEIKGKMDQFTQSGKGNSEEVQSLQKEYGFLETLLTKQTQGFASLTMEVRTNERQLAMMAEEGMQGTAAFNELQQATAKAKREITIFNQEQKLLSSQAPGLAAATVAAKGLAGIYATGAGAAALFADGNEKVEKELNKLVAIMTVLQGLEEFHQLIEQKGVVIQIAKNAVTAIGTVAQKIWTATMVESTAATVALRIALVGLTGGLLLLVPLLAFGMDKLSASMKNAKDKARELEIQQRLSNEIAEGSVDSFSKEKASLDILVGTLREEGISRAKKLEILKELHEKFPGYFDNIKDENDIVTKLADSYERASKGILLKAQASAAQDLLSDNYKKRLNLELQTNRDMEHIVKDGITAMTLERNRGDTGRIEANRKIYDNMLDNRKKAFREEVKDIDTENEFLLKSVLTANAEIDKLGGKDKPEKEKKASEFDPTAEQIKNEQELIKIKNELRALDLKDQQKYLKEIIDDERNTYALRLSALNLNNGIQKEIIQNQARTDLSETQVKLDKIEQIEAKAASKRTTEEKKLLLDKQVLLKQKELAERNAASGILQANIDLDNGLDKLEKEQTKKILKGIDDDTKKFKDQGISKVALEEAAAFAELSKKLDEGKISIEQYNLEHSKIADDANIKKLQAEKEALEQQFEVYSFFGLETADLEKQMADIDAKIGDEELKKKLDRIQKEKAAEKAKFDELKKLGEQFFSFSKALGDGIYQNEINKLQKQADANTTLKDAEIERINSSTLSEQDKAAKIAQINADAQAKQDQLDKRKRDAQHKQAVFDREMAILKIIANTAIAVTSDNASILTAWKVPYDIALGAIEIGTLLATPLPAYYTGVKSAPGGLALTDERGPELYIERGGNMFLGNDHPTIRNITPGTEIVRHDEVNQRLHLMMMERTANYIQKPQQDKATKEIMQLQNLVRWQTMKLEKAYKKQPNININNKMDFSRLDWLKRNIYE